MSTRSRRLPVMCKWPRGGFLRLSSESDVTTRSRTTRSERRVPRRAASTGGTGTGKTPRIQSAHPGVRGQRRDSRGQAACPTVVAWPRRAINIPGGEPDEHDHPDTQHPPDRGPPVEPDHPAMLVRPGPRVRPCRPLPALRHSTSGHASPQLAVQRRPRASATVATSCLAGRSEGGPCVSGPRTALSATIVTSCSNGACGNSQPVANRLGRLGYTAVRKYREGIQDWVAAGNPTGSTQAA